MNIFDAIIACGAQERLDIAKAIDNDIEKSTTHKFIRKESNGKGGFNYIYKEKDKEEAAITPTNKMIVSFKHLIDSDTNFVNYPSQANRSTLDTLKQYQTKIKNYKKVDSYVNLKDSTKTEIDYLIRYVSDKIIDLKERIKKSEEQEKHLKKFGHSSSYIDRRQK